MNRRPAGGDSGFGLWDSAGTVCVGAVDGRQSHSILESDHPRREYLEIPGLFLTPIQVQRLWELDAVVCDQVLDTLVGLRFLRRTPEGAFVRDHQRRD